MAKELIAWSEELSIGLPEVDNQHKRLVELVNDLDRAIRDRHGSDVACEMLRELAEYTRVHFATEESLMHASRYPFYDSHRIKHVDLIQQVVALQEKVDSGKTTISFELLHFLKNWLTQHILGSDKQFGAYFLDSIGRTRRITDTDETDATRVPVKPWWKFW